MLFQNSHLFHPLPGLHDFLFQPLAAGGDDCGVPSDSLLLLPKAKAEITFSFYPQTTRSWQMAEITETWAEPQVMIHCKLKAALHLLCTDRGNSTPISPKANGKHRLGRSLCHIHWVEAAGSLIVLFILESDFLFSFPFSK